MVDEEEGFGGGEDVDGDRVNGAVDRDDEMGDAAEVSLTRSSAPVIRGYKHGLSTS